MTDDSLIRAVRLIKQFEGCVLAAYPDPGSGGVPWTVGWGSTGEGIRHGVTWTQEQADMRLSFDVHKFAEAVDRLLGKAPATPGQRAALVSFAYNLGTGKLASSTLLKMHLARDYKGAALQFGRWNRAGSKVMAGLTKRRAAEAKEYLS